jgi:hypothetical protein
VCASGSLAAAGEFLRNSIQHSREAIHHLIDERYSIGLLAARDGSVANVVQASTAWNAGMGPLMWIAAINGQPWEADALRRAIADEETHALELEFVNGAERIRVTIPGSLGARFPHLHRNQNPHLISAIRGPRATPH